MMISTLIINSSEIILKLVILVLIIYGFSAGDLSFDSPLDVALSVLVIFVIFFASVVIKFLIYILVTPIYLMEIILRYLFSLLHKILTFIVQFFVGNKKTKPCKKCGKKHKGKKCRKNKC